MGNTAIQNKKKLPLTNKETLYCHYGYPATEFKGPIAGTNHHSGKMSIWNSLSYPTKFSIISCMIVAVAGLLSMGILGAGLYYPVSFLLKKYPSLNEWRGDWVWPATIAVGMGWSIAFIFGGLSWHYLSKVTDSKIILYSVYVIILWAWAAVLWYFTVKSNNPL